MSPTNPEEARRRVERMIRRTSTIFSRLRHAEVEGEDDEEAAEEAQEQESSKGLTRPPERGRPFR